MILNKRSDADIDKVVSIDRILGPGWGEFSLKYDLMLEVYQRILDRGFNFEKFFANLDDLFSADMRAARYCATEILGIIVAKEYSVSSYALFAALNCRGIDPIYAECFEGMTIGTEVEIWTPLKGFTKYTGKLVRYDSGDPSHSTDDTGYVVLNTGDGEVTVDGDNIYYVIPKGLKKMSTF